MFKDADWVRWVMNGLDIFIAGVVLFGLWRGFQAGLVKSIVALCGWFVALILGTSLAPIASPYFADVVQNPVLQLSLGFLSVVLVSLAVIHLIAFIFYKMLETLRLSFIDKLIGGVFGAAKNVVVILVILSVSAPMLIKSPMWQNSKLAPALMPYAPLAKTLVMEVFGKAWDQLNKPLNKSL